jgi:hypothetical protein
MTRLQLTAAALVVAMAFSSDAWAQRSGARPARPPQAARPARARKAPQGRSAQPSNTSPYLNLLRNNNNNNNVDRAVLYQGLIKPQIQSNRAQYNQQNQLNQMMIDNDAGRRDMQMRMQAQEEAYLDLVNQNSQAKAVTGHPTSFMNRSRHFPGLSK